MRRPPLLKRLLDRRRWPVAAGALVLALLLAQTLGLLHGIVHGLHAAGTHGVAAHADEEAGHSHSTHESHGPVSALFDMHEDESAECRLYDQLTHGDLLSWTLAAFALPPPLSAHAQRAAQAPRTAAPGWFLARAPPQRA